MNLENSLKAIQVACAVEEKTKHIQELNKRKNDAVAKSNEAFRVIIEHYLYESKYADIVTLFDKISVLMLRKPHSIDTPIFVAIQHAYVCLKVDAVHGIAGLTYNWAARYVETVRIIRDHLLERRRWDDAETFMAGSVDGLNAVCKLDALSASEQKLLFGTMLIVIPLEIGFYSHKNPAKVHERLLLLESYCIGNEIHIAPSNIETSARCLLYYTETQRHGMNHLWCCVLSQFYNSLLTGVLYVPALVYFPAARDFFNLDMECLVESQLRYGGSDYENFIILQIRRHREASRSTEHPCTAAKTSPASAPS